MSRDSVQQAPATRSFCPSRRMLAPDVKSFPKRSEREIKKHFDFPDKEGAFLYGGGMKHKLTKQDQARGLRKALRSRKTPKWLKPSIRGYLRKLEGKTRP